MPTLRMLTCAALLAISGCASYVPADPAKMSADQIAAYSKDKAAVVSCTVVNSPYGRGVLTFIQLDKGTIPPGSVTADDQCKVTVSGQKEKE